MSGGIGCIIRGGLSEDTTESDDGGVSDEVQWARKIRECQGDRFLDQLGTDGLESVVMNGSPCEGGLGSFGVEGGSNDGEAREVSRVILEHSHEALDLKWRSWFRKLLHGKELFRVWSKAGRVCTGNDVAEEFDRGLGKMAFGKLDSEAVFG